MIETDKKFLEIKFSASANFPHKENLIWKNCTKEDVIRFRLRISGKFHGARGNSIFIPFWVSLSRKAILCRLANNEESFFHLPAINVKHGKSFCRAS